jgi:hypothetical protein
MSTVPESRTYRHVKCQTETTVNGQQFEVMSNPMSDLERSWCVQCNSFFPLAEYEWADTGENVTAYYARLNAKATNLQRFLVSKKCMLILGSTGLVLGAIGGGVLVRNNGVGAIILMTLIGGGFGGFAGLAFYISALCNPITRNVCGVSDTRTLV